MPGVGGVITTGSHPKALWPGVKVWWGKVYNEYPVEWDKLVDPMPSEKNYEELVQDIGFGLAQVKPQGQGITYDADQQGYVARLVHVTYALGYIVTMEELQDNLYEAVSMRRAAANAFSQRQTKETVAAAIYNNGFTNSAAYLGADGKPLFATDHPRISGGTYANKPSVDADLTEASLEDALIDIAGFTNDRGLIIQVQPERLLVHRSNLYNATRIVQSVYQSGTANNDINAMKMLNAIPKGVAVNHFFTSPNAWFLKNNIPASMGGLVCFDRYKSGLDQDNDFDTKNAKAASVERYSMGWGDPRTAYGVNAP
jgi:hypothetical protein